MTRTAILAALLLATIPVSDWLVDVFPPSRPVPPGEESGYRTQDIKAIDKLLEPKRIEADKLRRRQAVAYARLYGIQDADKAEKLLPILSRKQYAEDKFEGRL